MSGFGWQSAARYGWRMEILKAYTWRYIAVSIPAGTDLGGDFLLGADGTPLKGADGTELQGVV